jgi:5-amino-6-(5-phosphoribosylamino)uracil reductase
VNESPVGKPHYFALDLPPPPPDRPYVLVNMVMSADGRAVFEGSERGLGSSVDQRLMRELRANADVVLNGAETFRVSGSSPRLGDPALEELRRARGKPPVPIGAVLTGSGDLDTTRLFFTAEDFEGVVFVLETTPEARRRAIEATGRKVVELPPGETIRALLRYLRLVMQCQVLLVEGGPSLNGQFFAHRAVDEYFVTIGPVIVGGADELTPVRTPKPFTREHAPRLTLLSAVPNPETGEVYCRYRVSYPG